MTYDLSILIPARSEWYYNLDLLGHTVTNVLENTSDRCEIVTVLDGQWSLNPLLSHPRLTVIHHNKSIGQRAATNEAARVATGEWVCKLDAHCAVDKDFDVKLIEGMEDDWTVVAGQYNLQAFQWKCKRCGWLKDQSPKPTKCEKCGSQYIKLIPLWFPRDGRENSDGVGGRRTAYTHSWRFDTNLDFQYFGAYGADEKYCKKRGFQFRPEAQGKVHDTMSLLGACWAMRRERYFYLEPCDELFGSWGDMGTEISCKSWLSGGRLVVNQNTWFAHFFRVGGIGFPYEGGGRKERAKAQGKELWLTNSWPKQVYPLSWLIEKFKPLPDWHSNNNPILAAVNDAGKAFANTISSVGFSNTDSANSSGTAVREVCHGGGQKVTVDAVSLHHIDDATSLGVSTNVVPVVGNQFNMGRVAAGLVVANNMIEDGDSATSASRQGSNEPSIHIPMGQLDISAVPVGNVPIPISVAGANPNPAISLTDNSGENANQLLGRDVGNGEHSGSHGLTITNKSLIGYLYYTCNTHDETIELAARNNLLSLKGGNEIGCVSRERTDFGDWNIVVDRELSAVTMHYQILEGLKRMRSDYVFMCENDILYHSSHFQFVPPDDGTFWYNTNVWRVRSTDGHAVRTDDCKQTSGLCANRLLLLEHYRKRIELIGREGEFPYKKMAYEPGTRGKFEGDRTESWQSPFPNIDIRHGKTLTGDHWTIDSFRNPKYAAGWQETDEQIEGWPKLSDGGLQQLLMQLSNNEFAVVVGGPKGNLEVG